MFRKNRIVSAILAAGALSLAACGGDNDNDIPGPIMQAVGDTVVLTASGRVVSFNRAAPATQVGAVAVTGLAAGDVLVGIDYRSADGLLYALSNGGRLYTVDPSTGTATLKSTLRAAAGDDSPFTVLAGTRFGVDFNPVVDRLRVVSDSGQNLRINVDTGDVTTDAGLAAAAGAVAISASAYTNAFAGASSTELLGIDAATGLLFDQTPPNAGTLINGVALGVSGAAAVNGFDIDARNNTGYAALSIGTATTLYSINLDATATAATSLGAVAGAEQVVGLALVQPRPASVLGLTADNRLATFDPRTPNTISANVAITGLAAGEMVVGIDFRPSDRLLYALTGNGRLYTIDPATGAATSKSTLSADATDTSAPYTALAGTVFSVDFNPAADRLRVVSSTGQSLRINVDTGATTTDGSINRLSGAASVVAAAYSNSFAGTTTTTLFDLDATSDVLARQTPPNDGTLVDVGALGIDIAASGAAFDIGGGGNAAYAALRSGATGPFSLYSVSLTTGLAALLGNTGGNAALSQIGGATGPALIDIAVRL